MSTPSAPASAMPPAWAFGLLSIMSLAFSAVVGTRVAARSGTGSPVLWLGAAALTAGLLMGAIGLLQLRFGRRPADAPRRLGAFGFAVLVHMAAACYFTWIFVR